MSAFFIGEQKIKNPPRRVGMSCRATPAIDGSGALRGIRMRTDERAGQAQDDLGQPSCMGLLSRVGRCVHPSGALDQLRGHVDDILRGSLWLIAVVKQLDAAGLRVVGQPAVQLGRYMEASSAYRLVADAHGRGKLRGAALWRDAVERVEQLMPVQSQRLLVRLGDGCQVSCHRIQLAVRHLIARGQVVAHGLGALGHDQRPIVWTRR